ncbi:MAG: flagellar motor switch protein FliG [Oscillibacter sp.]|nr:flagellar motor switch protein FliG [Oscillibacter sp.]
MEAPSPADLIRNMTGMQKAAAVIIALGADEASLIYQHMDPEDVEQVTLEVARIGFLSMDVSEAVLTEFYQMCMMNKAVSEGGLEYARSVLEKAFGNATAATLLSKITKSLKSREFAFLNKANYKDLFAILQNERPQIIALVLSYVTPDRAAGVLEQLEGQQQIRVVENMALMDSASPAYVKLVETEMARRFDNIFQSDANVKVGGIDFVASVMNNLDRASEKSIFDGLSVTNETLAEDIRKRMFVFEDIVTMDDRSVQRFLRDCDNKDVVLALKAAAEDVSNKLFANMSTRMAASIRDDLEITTNVRMKDVEEAQQRIVDVIRKLEDQGEIVILKGGKDDIIA